jgi:prepilin-type N-terminal cleavage/methylation domain-containing protein
MNTKGFTLIEFIVIMSIFAIMASVALFNFQGFRSNVAVNNLAQDIGLLARQAQTFGWSTISEQSGGQIKLDGVGAGDPLRYANGIYFKYASPGFTDTISLYQKETSDINEQYYENLTDTLVDTITIQGPYQVVAIKTAALKSDLTINTNNQIPTSVNDIPQDVSIAFSRPKPEASMFAGPSLINSSSENYLGIYIGSAGQTITAEKVVIISRSGEIWIE